MGRVKLNRKVYHITLDKLARNFVEDISCFEGLTYSYVISKAVVEYMRSHYPERAKEREVFELEKNFSEK